MNLLTRLFLMLLLFAGVRKADAQTASGGSPMTGDGDGIHIESQTAIEADTALTKITVRPVQLPVRSPEWDGMSLYLNAYHLDGGYYGYAGPQPTPYLDSLPVDITFMGWQNLNMLPVYLPDLKRYSENATPGGHGFDPDRAGRVDYLTAAPEKGLELGGNIYLGNETGDPGPWAYDSSTVTSNVDRWGIDGGGRLSYRRGGWYAKGILQRRNHKQTDNRTYRRLRNIMNRSGLSTTGFVPYPIESVSDSWLAETGYLGERWKVRARHMDLKDKNYIYLQPLGREVPALAEYKQWAGEVTHQNGRWQTTLRYTDEQKELSRRTENHIPIFDWELREQAFSGSVGVSLGNGDTELRTSAGMESSRARAPGLDGLVHNVYRVSGGIRHYFSENNSQLALDGNMDFLDTDQALQLKLTGEVPLTRAWSIENKVLYHELLPLHRQTYGYWLSRGYQFYGELGLTVDPNLNLEKDRLYAFSVKHRIQLSPNAEMVISQNLIRHATLNIPWQRVSYSRSFDTEPGVFQIFQENGTRLISRLGIRHRWSEQVSQDFSLRLKNTLSGSDRYRHYFRQQPILAIHYDFAYHPTENLALNMNAVYRSSTYWEEFRDIEGQMYFEVANPFPLKNGVFSSTVPPHLDIQLSARKYFWERRMSVQFTIDNLLNDQVQYHPIGADKALVFHVRAAINL